MSMPTWMQLSESWDRQRASAAEQKIKEEEMARKRSEWAFQDQQNAAIDAERATAIEAASRPLADANSAGGFKAALGLDVPQSAAAMRRGDERFQYGQADVATPEAPGSQPQFALDQQANTLSTLRMAGRNPQLIGAARQADTGNRLNADAARIASYAQSADPAELKDLMGKVTLDKRNKFDTQFDEKTGITRIKHGADSVDLSRADLGKFLAAQYRLKNGDATAAAEIEAIDSKLAKISSESLQVASTLAKSGNDATHTESQIRNDNLRTGSAMATASMARADHAKAKSDAQAKAAAGVELYKETHPQATAAQLEAVRTGILAAAPSIDSHAPSEVKLAQAFRAAGLATNDADALKMAIQSKSDSPEKVRSDIYGKALTANMGDAARAQAATTEAMKYLYPSAPAAASPVATFSSNVDAEKAAKEGKLKKGDRISVGGVIGSWQ